MMHNRASYGQSFAMLAAVFSNLFGGFAVRLSATVRSIRAQGHDQLVGMVFAFFLFLIFFVYLLIPELVSLAGVVVTALSTGEQAIIGVVGIVVVAMLIYGLYKHGSR